MLRRKLYIGAKTELVCTGNRFWVEGYWGGGTLEVLFKQEILTTMYEEKMIK